MGSVAKWLDHPVFRQSLENTNRRLRTMTKTHSFTGRYRRQVIRDLTAPTAPIDAAHQRWRFMPRVPTLLALEGWYPLYDGPNVGKRVKLSCRFNDILRAAASKHYAYSCFNHKTGGGRHDQVFKRLVDPSWAVVMLLDKAGTPQSRSWVCLTKGIPEQGIEPKLLVSPIQGTGLTQEAIINCLHHVIRVEALGDDVYL